MEVIQVEENPIVRLAVLVSDLIEHLALLEVRVEKLEADIICLKP
jgi:hypothetical protein